MHKVHVGGGAAAQLSGTLVKVGAGLAISVLLTRRFGLADFGLFTVGFAAMLLTSLVARLGLDTAVVHFVANPLARGDDRLASANGWAAVRASLVTGVVAGIILWLAAPLASNLFEAPRIVPILHAFAAAVPFANVLFVASAALRGAELTRAYAVLLFIVYPGARVLAIGAASIVSNNIVVMAIVTAAATAATAVVAVVTLARQMAPVSLSGAGLPAMLRLGGWAAMTRGAHNGLQWADLLVVMAFLPSVAAGMYRAGAQAATLIGLAVTALAMLFAPLCSRLLSLGQGADLEDVTQSLARISLFVTGIPAIAVFVDPTIVLFVFGADLEGAVPAFRLLVSSYILIAALGPFYYILIMGNAADKEFLATFAGLAVATFSAFMLVPRLGMTGAAIGTLMGFSTRAMLQLWAIQVIHHMTPLSRPLMAGILGLVTFATSGLVVVHLAPVPALVAALGSAGAFTFWALSLALTPEDRHALIGVLQNSIRGRRNPIARPANDEMSL